MFGEVKKIGLILLAAVLQAFSANAQYPHYFIYDNENGLPSNEVYSIVQDQKGFLWIGCDGGLFKFDGVRYTSYKCPTQNSKSISNLTLARDGRIYCTNFQDQLFYLDDGHLIELDHTLHKLSNLAIDSSGLLYVNHAEGVAVFDSKNNTWTKTQAPPLFTRSIQIDAHNHIYYLSPSGIAQLQGLSVTEHPLPGAKHDVSSYYLLACHKDMVMVAKRDESTFYFFQNNIISKNPSIALSLALQNRKVTNIKSLSDGLLWICTYTGLICYNMEKDTTVVYYPDLSFSDILLDREGNYWFTTLQSGLLRVPNLDYLVWNNTHPEIINDKLSHITSDGSSIYFSSTTGSLGRLDIRSSLVQTFQTNKNADIECLYLDTLEQQLLFNQQNKSFQLDHQRILPLQFQTNSIKSMIHTGEEYFFATSSGLYAEFDNQREKLTDGWIRQLDWNGATKTLYAATNKGLLIFNAINHTYSCLDTLYANTQMVSIDVEADHYFALSFNGKLFQNSAFIAQLPENVLGRKLLVDKGQVYIATNKGVWVYQLATKHWTPLNHLSGLASENVQDLLLIDQCLWLATGRGLLKIPIAQPPTMALATIYLREEQENFDINYGQPLILHPEASAYSSHGQYQYAYRVNQGDWIYLPSSIDQITIQHLPSGTCSIEVKVVDHLGRDSQNILFLNVNVHPPIWQRWWFIGISIAIGLLLILLYLKRRIEKLKRIQQTEIARITLENELRLTQQSALKAQMNPHFIFNVLNSIKGYIYENDKKNASLYLSRFSDLIRKILDQSSAPKIRLSEEIETLKLYIQLEALLLEVPFAYHIEIEDPIPDIYLPALLIQPLVENAFKHGLHHKHGEKKLHIAFSIHEQTLSVNIEDNGIGRKASGAINEQRSHQSFASDALAQRIQLLNAEDSKTIGLQIIDLYDEAGVAKGTRVHLNIKIDL